MAVEFRTVCVSFVIYLIYGIVILAIAGSFRNENQCLVKVYENLNLVVPPETSFGADTTYLNYTFLQHGELVKSIGIDNWLYVEGSFTLAGTIITLFWFSSYQSNWQNNEKGCYFFMNFVVTIYCLFQICWTIVGAFMIWRDCPHIERTHNLNLAYACVLIGFGNCMKSNKIVWNHIWEKNDSSTIY
jgi:hypothetical protein